MLVCALIGAAAGAGAAFVLADDESDTGGGFAVDGDASEPDDDSLPSDDPQPDEPDSADDPEPVEVDNPPSTTETPQPPPEPERMTASEVLAQTGSSVVAIEATGCRHGTFASGVVVGPNVVVGPYGLRFRAGHAQFVGDGAVIVEAVVSSTTDELTFLSATGLPATVVDFASPEPQILDEVFVVYRNRDAFTSEVIEAQLSDATSTAPTYVAEGAPAEVLGGLVVAASGEPIGVVTNMVGDELRVATAVAVTDGEPGPDPATLPCPSTDVGVPSSGWADFAQPEVSSALLAQYLADSLAFGDWPKVRTLEPGKSDYADSRFEEGWGTLQVSTLIPVWWEETAPSVFRLRMGLVAHEVVDGTSVTKVFCVTWVADIANGRLEQLNQPLSKRVESLETVGFMPPNSVTAAIDDQCRTIEGD